VHDQSVFLHAPAWAAIHWPEVFQPLAEITAQRLANIPSRNQYPFDAMSAGKHRLISAISALLPPCADTQKALKQFKLCFVWGMAEIAVSTHL
jgi:hypothetical protein